MDVKIAGSLLAAVKAEHERRKKDSRYLVEDVRSPLSVLVRELLRERLLQLREENS